MLGAGSKPYLWPESFESGHAGFTLANHFPGPSGAPALSVPAPGSATLLRLESTPHCQ